MWRVIRLAFIATVAVAEDQPLHGLEASLSRLSEAPHQALMRLDITNVGERAIHFLKWNTPFDGVKNNIFSVVDSDGVETTYLGILMKRGPPQMEDFVFIAPNQTITVAFDLSRVYLFDSPNKTYSISFSSYVQWVSGTIPLSSLIRHPAENSPITYAHIPFESLDHAPLSSLSVTLYVPKPLSALPPPRERSTVGVVNFPGCTSTQQTQINAAIALAKTMASTCVSYLSGSSCDSGFVTWFGRYSGSTRWAFVQGHFSRISTKFNSNVFNVNCGSSSCKGDIFAYVYPTDSSYTIYVCGAFWSAPNSVSYDSRPGTLIHEMSHFSPIAGTQDHTYGTSGAKDLASRNPDGACSNADNHEYFSESNPRC